MLSIVVKGAEVFDDSKQEFFDVEDFALDLEHSLISLSKWESKWKIPFLSKGDRTAVQLLSYIECMILNLNYPKDILTRLSNSNLDEIRSYIESKESATTFGEMPETKGPNETITSELIYFWMVNYNIPFSCETWHLNRLFSLIKICNIKNAKPGKTSKRQMAERNRKLNEERKALLNTSG